MKQMFNHQKTVTLESEIAGDMTNVVMNMTTLLWVETPVIWTEGLWKLVYSWILNISCTRRIVTSYVAKHHRSNKEVLMECHWRSTRSLTIDQKHANDLQKFQKWSRIFWLKVLIAAVILRSCCIKLSAEVQPTSSFINVQRRIAVGLSGVIFLASLLDRTSQFMNFESFPLKVNARHLQWIESSILLGNSILCEFLSLWPAESV